ncbi:LEA type 2 family protein [Ideonella sp.]|uniref:LEA type 2 family protein n=1 Tax=Ideonella sp. TaxID=1929293 RepID=UPI003BB70416
MALSRRWSWLLALFVAIGLLSGCGTLGQTDPVQVTVAGIEAMDGQGLELRFKVKLRLQNPNDSTIAYDGVALDLDLNGKRLASGVSDQKGTLPRYGEIILEVPVTISAFAAVRQAIGLSQDKALEQAMPYTLTGKLGGGLLGTVRFTHSGTLSLPR